LISDHRNKKKIINDPLYGFISLPYNILYDIIEHPWFQRLRRIKQLGFTHMVYPGALHTRFHHAIGAMHLMTEAVDVLRSKKVAISKAEAKAATLAILLHDIGHGPFSHALEHTIISKVSHEHISSLLMHKLNAEFDGKLDLAIEIFEGKYHRKFFHQLVSSQLDMDRLDYLLRDSFYTGVSEGIVGTKRIIKMLNVHNDELVIEQKGIYSVEKFLVARRIMYWQVYLHKTVVSAECLVVSILKRAKHLATKGVELFATPALHYFLYNAVSLEDFKDQKTFDCFTALDDHDISVATKVWSNHEDKVLSELCTRLVNRRLFKVEISREPFSTEQLNALRKAVQKDYSITADEATYLVINGNLENNAYSAEKQPIRLLTKNNELIDVAKASDNLNLNALAEPVKKYFIAYPKGLS